jgi:hypothetical protein
MKAARRAAGSGSWVFCIVGFDQIIAWISGFGLADQNGDGKGRLGIACLAVSGVAFVPLRFIVFVALRALAWCAACQLSMLSTANRGYALKHAKNTRQDLVD